MASHTRKKPYTQSSKITSFFPPSLTSTPPNPSDISSSAPPQLPSQIQSSLLNVGMRVRKSVPEGYKTHKPPPPAPQRHAVPVPASSAPPAPVRGRELMPFCELLSVGGLPSSQGVAVPALGWSSGRGMGSESSFSSCGSVEEGRAGNKRALEDEHGEAVEDELDEYFGTTAGPAGPVPGRVFAVPRGSKALGLGRREVDDVKISGDFDDTDVGFLQERSDEEMEG